MLFSFVALQLPYEAKAFSLNFHQLTCKVRWKNMAIDNNMICMCLGLLFYISQFAKRDGKHGNKEFILGPQNSIDVLL